VTLPRRPSGHRTYATRLMYKTWSPRRLRALGQLNVAVNNAGTEGKPGPVPEHSAETYPATFDTNVLGTLSSMKHELRVVLPQRHGSIVNVSSTYGHLGAAGASLYAAK
jgi:NAD(P)-dependent dehydrogenase (short-subunit alcohol dehydrogenase family)